MTDSAEPPNAIAPLAPLGRGAGGEGSSPPGLVASSTTSDNDSALCRVIYVRVTPDELAKLKSNATTAKVSLQRHARITLGLTDRGGYRNRKEQKTNGKVELQSTNGNHAPIPTKAQAQA